jgi:hypothetical protein
MLEKNFEKVDSIFGIVYPDQPDCRGPMLVDDTPLPETIEGFLAERTDSLSKASAVANPDYEPGLEQILGIADVEVLESEPFAKNAPSDWDEELGAPRVELSKNFLARSDARLERVNEQIRKLFHGHYAEMAEALQLVKDGRADVREEFGEQFAA